MDQAELAFIDGTHPALLGNAPAPSSPRSQSPTTRSSRTLSASSASSASSTSSSPRFSAVDPDPPTQSVNPKFNPKAGNGGASNTGPKGVIADWKNSQIGVASQHGKNLEGLIKLGTGPGEAPGLFSLDAGTGRGGVDIVQRREDGDEEERAKEAYRERRKDELRGSGERVMKGKVFGHLREIGIHQFLNAIEDDSGIAVVIHLYEPSFEDCEILNYHLTSIARAYPYTKFLRALAAEMDYATDLEEAALPTLLVYRNGELETSLVGMNRDWGNGTREEILAILVKNETLSRIPTIPFEGSKGPTLAGRDSSGEDSD